MARTTPAQKPRGEHSNTLSGGFSVVAGAARAVIVVLGSAWRTGHGVLCRVCQASAAGRAARILLWALPVSARPRESGDPANKHPRMRLWMPAYAGMSGRSCVVHRISENHAS